MAKPASGTALDTGNALFTSLTAVWGMLEGTGTTSADSTGNGHTLTLNTSGSGVTWSTDANADACLAFAGCTTVAAPITSPIAFNGTASYSFAWRGKQTSADSNGIFAGNENNGSLVQFLFWSSGTLFRARTNTIGQVDYDFGITSAVTEANWLLVYDQPGAKLHLWQNGVESGTGMTVTTNQAGMTWRSLGSGYDAVGDLVLIGKLSYGYLWSGRALTGSDASTLNSNPYVIFQSGGGGGVSALPTVVHSFARSRASNY